VEEILAMRETGLVEVDVGVDGAREDEEARGVDGLLPGGRLESLRDPDEAAVLDPEVGAGEVVSAGEGHHAVPYDHGRFPWR